MHRTRFAVAVLAATVAACHGTDPIRHVVGTDSFLSQPPGGSMSGTQGPAGTMGADAAGAPVPAAAPSTADAAATRAIEEADIYKRDGTLLYVLNTYRGLQIVDLTDLSAPRLVGHVAVTGTPIDLYVRGRTAILAVNDAFSYELAADGSMEPHHGSRVLAVDVADPGHPAVASDLRVEGEVEQTRLVGDVLYVVSHRYSWYDWIPAGRGIATAPVAGSDTIYVASFDLQDPAHPAAVDRIDFPATGWQTHANVTAERITVSFAGYGTDDLGSWGQNTRFQVVDISDPRGAMAKGASFATRGLVTDRWGMDYDASTGLFRAVTNLGWNVGAGLDVWSSPGRDQVTRLSHLDVPVAESLTAARFDGSRVYLVTSYRSDPLWAVDATDPARPRVAGSVAMPGQLDFLEPRGDRLVALGHTNEGGVSWQLAVSLLDVTDLSRPALLSRVLLGSGPGQVAARPDDLRKAFIVLDATPGAAGLVLVPFQGWDGASYRYRGGTQLVDLGRDALTLRGFLAHPGMVTRAFPLDAAFTRLAALSDSALQTIDATSRSSPSEIARLDLARSVATLAVVGDKAVELAGDWSTGAMELAVTDALDPDEATPLARVDLAAPQARMLRDGDVLWILSHDGSAGSSWLRAVDVSDPARPVSRGELDLAAGDSFADTRRWGFGDEALLVGHVLAVHHQSWICPATCLAGAGAGVVQGEIALYDLSDPDRPRLASKVLPPGAAWAWGLAASGHFLWLTHFEWETQQQTGRFFLDRIDVSDPGAPTILPKINIPGIFLAASPDGSTIHTVETAWETDHATTWLHRLHLGATAVLEASLELEGYPTGIATSPGYAWAVVGPGAYGAPSRLLAVDLGAMRATSEQEIQGSWAWLRTATGGKLFLDAGWTQQGLLVYDLSDPARPAFDRFFRTPGWVWDVVVADGRAYLPSGPYGVPVIDLR